VLRKPKVALLSKTTQLAWLQSSIASPTVQLSAVALLAAPASGSLRQLVQLVYSAAVRRKQATSTGGGARLKQRGRRTAVLRSCVQQGGGALSSTAGLAS